MKRKSLITALILVVSLSAKAQEPYFCTKPGSVLYYERYSTKDKKLLQTTTFEIEKVSDTPQGGKLVEYGVKMKKANGKNVYGERAELKVGITAAGDVQMYLGHSAQTFLKGQYPKFNIKATESIVPMPIKMKPGDTLKSAHSVLTVMGMDYDIDILGRTVLSSETITTPAGTFKCMAIKELKNEDGPMHHSKIWSVTWYAPGIGYVRHDEFDKNMKLESSEVLVKYTPGK